MLQKTNVESAEQSAQRLTNQLILRFLESKVPPHVFKGILGQVEATMDLPTHTAWDGSEVRSTFDELKVSQEHLDDKILPDLVRSLMEPKNEDFKPLSHKNNLTHYLSHQASPENEGQQNIFAHLHQQLGRFQERPRKLTGLYEIAKLERVKTVFCHADFQTDEVSSIFNVQFDQTGTFIVSGADDGIIKIWDRDTLTLQASLHGHSDYITDMDISKCNQYIATAGKDAQIIIWELATGQMIQKLQHHQNLINRIQFYSPQKTKDGQSSVQEQFLLSCSDDGTVRLYDFSPLCQTAQGLPTRSPETDQFKVRKSSRHRLSTESPIDKTLPLLTIELTPDDFRPGVRNKKLDTLALNHNGLVVAGSNTGEMFVWRVNYDHIMKRMPKQDCHRFLGQFKIHKNSGIQFCEFNPKNGVPAVGDLLMTGSTDGIVKVWKMAVSSWRSGERNFSMEDKEKLMLEIDENRGCLYTREIVSSDLPSEITVKEYLQEQVLAQGQLPNSLKTKFLKSQCDAVRWSVNGRFAISSITSRVERKNEEECHIKIWDTVEQVFYDDLARHSGLTLKKNTWVLAPHPFHEEILMTGSDGGMLILWNIQSKQILKKFYQNGVYSIDAFVMDNPLDGKWSPDGKAFIVGNQLGTISLYTCESFKMHQYEATRVQQFYQFDIARQQDNPFCKVTERPQICGYNMVPYEVQSTKPLIRFAQDHINSKQFERKLLLGKELGKMEEKYYQDQVANSFNNLPPSQGARIIESLNESVIPIEMGDEEMVQDSILQVFSPMRVQRSRPQQNSSAVRAQPSRRLQRGSLIQAHMRRNNGPPAPPLAGVYNFDEEEVQNVRISSDSEEQIQDGSESETPFHSEIEEIQTRRNESRIAEITRPTRANGIGRETRRGPAVQEDGGRNMRTRRRIQLESSIDSYSDSEEETKLQTTQPRGRGAQPTSGRLVASNGRSRTIRESSQDDTASLEDKPRTRKNTSGRATRTKLIADESYEQEQPQARKAGLSSYLSDQEVKNDAKPQQFTSHMLITAHKFIKSKCETSYDLVENAEAESICHLCNRTDSPLVGPFQKKGGVPVYFHKECIEVNPYSYYKVSVKKWVNIESMLKHLKEDAQYKCFRCEKQGASISCITCGRNFHGFQCASLYMINLGIPDSHNQNSEGINYTQWQCLFCRNTENFESQVSVVKNQKNYLNSLRKIDKSHLIKNVQHLVETNKLSTYVPQVDDLVYYFFQGHENYFYQHNCHFFAGQTLSYPIEATMPWLSTHNHIREKQLALCRVTSVLTLFPSERSLALISEFGRDTTQITQTPQMIQRVTLQIINSVKDLNSDKIFYVDLFPNELPDFLVLEHLLREQKNLFCKQDLAGKQVKIKTKKGIDKVDILHSSCPLEPSYAPTSLWLNVVCTKSVVPAMNPQHRSARNTAFIEDNVLRINFWDIVFDQSIPPPNAFTTFESIKLVQTLQNFMLKKKEYLIYFRERVNEQIARDYRVMIAQEMWFDLLLERLQKNYYRSQKQFLSDLDQISLNAAAYNGAEHEVAVDAHEIVQKVRMDLLKCIDEVGENHMKERVQEAGKLTAPTKMRTEAEIQGTYDQLRRVSPAEVTTRTRVQIQAQVEETKEPQETKLGKRKRNMIELETAKNASSQEDSHINNGGGNSGRQLRNKRPRIL